MHRLLQQMALSESMKFDLSGLFSRKKWIPLYALGGQGLQIQLSLTPANLFSVVAARRIPRVIFNFGQISEVFQVSSKNPIMQLLNGTSLKMPIKS